MNIDERLDRLVQRHEALTQSVELLWRQSQRHDELLARHDELLARNEKLIADLITLGDMGCAPLLIVLDRRPSMLSATPPRAGTHR